MRIANDYYPTNRRLGEALFRLLPTVNGPICEPCSGTNDLANVIERATNRKIMTNDIDPDMPALLHGDAADPSSKVWHGQHYNWVITNPPFNAAAEIMRCAWDCTDNLVVLLRLSFFEPTKDRASLLRNLSNHMFLFAPVGQTRPQFRFGINPKTGKKYSTDSVTVAWCGWSKHHRWSDTETTSPFQFITNWNT